VINGIRRKRFMEDPMARTEQFVKPVDPLRHHLELMLESNEFRALPTSDESRQELETPDLLQQILEAR